MPRLKVFRALRLQTRGEGGRVKKRRQRKRTIGSTDLVTKREKEQRPSLPGSLHGKGTQLRYGLELGERVDEELASGEERSQQRSICETQQTVGKLNCKNTHTHEL